jgi:hypothetical protein
LVGKELAQREAKKFHGLPTEFVSAYIAAAVDHRKAFVVAYAELGKNTIGGMLFLIHGRVASYHMGWADTEGRQLWEYSENRRRPAMEVQFDRQGRVAGARWLRGEADVLRALAERPARRDALALLGQPSAVEISARGLIWRYRSARGAGLVVQFGDDGRVQSITAAR